MNLKKAAVHGGARQPRALSVLSADSRRAAPFVARIPPRHRSGTGHDEVVDLAVEIVDPLQPFACFGAE